MKIAITVFMAAMVFSCFALPAGVNAENPCHNLELTIPKGWHIQSVRCTKGSAVTWGSTWATLRQDHAYGPSCGVSVRDDSGYRLSCFDVHQDFCFLEARDITVIRTTKTGHKPVYRITKGSWNHQAGKIEVTDFVNDY